MVQITIFWELRRLERLISQIRLMQGPLRAGFLKARHQTSRPGERVPPFNLAFHRFTNRQQLPGFDANRTLFTLSRFKSYLVACLYFRPLQGQSQPIQATTALPALLEP